MIIMSYFIDEPKKNARNEIRRMNYETCEFGNLDFRIHSANFSFLSLQKSTKYDIDNYTEFWFLFSDE